MIDPEKIPCLYCGKRVNSRCADWDAADECGLSKTPRDGYPEPKRTAIKRADMKSIIALALGVAALSATFGVMSERYIWEAKTMGVLCKEGRQWACRLHPKCSMQSLICFPNIDFKEPT